MNIKLCLAAAASAAAVLVFAAFTPTARKTTTPIYLNTSYSFEERAVDLVSRLTLEEKESLLGNNMAAIPRLGIRNYNIWSEALHGILGGANPAAGLQGPTSFPNSVALGSSWDPDLLEREASAIADEARAIFQTKTRGLTFWSPVVEPIRDPRWGRTGESYGEDPFLAATMAGGYVRGLMGNDGSDYLKAVPCAKHYFANNSEFNRHVSSSNMDNRDMREFYLYPYKELIENDGIPSIMSSYNAVNEVPTSASKFYLDDIARKTYGLKGYVTGDCAAIEDIYTGHYFVNTAEEATAKGLTAGVDSDCGSVYQRYAIKALEKGLIRMADIDRALVNVFAVRMRTGEFDPDPKVPYSMLPPSTVNSEKNQALAMEIATRTPVLMKNERKALPIDLSKVHSIALVGPQADKVELGPYSGRPEDSSKITPYQGIMQYIADKGLDINVTVADGASTKSKSNLLYIGYFETVKADGTVKHYDATQYTSSSEGITVGSGMGDEEQVRTIDDGSWTAYDNIDLVDVEQLTVGLNIPTEGGIVEAHVDSPDGNLICRIEATRAAGMQVGGVYGTSIPATEKVLKLGINDLRTLYLVYKAPEDEEIDPAIIKTASEADVAIVFVGTDEKTATEEADRLTLLLPGNQPKLIRAIADANPNTILVMQTLGCVEVEDFKDLDNIPGILWTGYNGQAQGAAIPKILFGDVNPGGKLNATWYKSVKDLPAITDYTLRKGEGKNGRTLWYFDQPVSYEFGYGLSYTTFEYSNFRISKNAITPEDHITISVDITNTGDYDGDEVVQVYMTTPDSPAELERPIKRLKGYKRVTVPVGQKKTVDIDIDCSDLWFWDLQTNRMTYDSGRYAFEVGSSSKDIRGTVFAKMDGRWTPELKLVTASCGSSVLRTGESSLISTSACLDNDSFIYEGDYSVEYSSNNPAVASVSRTGRVTAQSMGVATITAKVTHNGVTKCGSFAIKVMPELTLKALKVDNRNVLKEGVSQYSFVRKAGSKVPVVKAEATSPDVFVEIEQAKSIPGTAVVKVIDYVTYDVNEYYLNFGPKAWPDNFKGLGQKWNIVREDKSAWTMDGGQLTITSQPGDITLANNNASNLFLQTANNDWLIETKLSTSALPGMPSQNAGLVAYSDDDNFVKLVYGGAAFGRGMRMDPSAAPAGSIQLITEFRGNNMGTVSVSLSGKNVRNNTVWLRLIKRGDKYTAYYSVDGKRYEKAGETELMLKDVQAGMTACEGVRPAMPGFGGGAPGFRMPGPAADPTPLTVKFYYFDVR